MLTRAPETDVVLIVDDMPDNLAVLHDTLDLAGYTVLVATDGASALERIEHWMPDLILLDAVMPGLDGFETCRRIKGEPQTRHIPVIFMTGLTDSEHVVEGFRVGGVDYVTKPVRPDEVLARMSAHLRHARLMTQTRRAFDASGKALIALDETGRVLWQTPLALKLLGTEQIDAALPAAFSAWFRETIAHGGRDETSRESVAIRVFGQRLICSVYERAPEGHFLILLQPGDPILEPELLMDACHLTLREAEVLYWVALGKTNRDIGDILGLSPRTVNKHLEHVFSKLGVETRTAAAGIALSRTSVGPHK